MRGLAEFTKTTLIGGGLIVLPAYLAILLLVKGLAGLLALLKPVTEQIPAAVHYRQLAALAIVLAVCFFAGLLVRTRPGSLVRKVLEERFLSRIPGYEILRGLTLRLTGSGEESSFTPALVEVEDGAVAPALIIEELPDGRYTVMVPSVPTPAAGAIFVLARERVHPVDVPLATMLRLFSQFGSGTAALVAEMERADAAAR